jgi:hypothetical protein
MNTATGHFASIDMLKEYACSVLFAQKKTLVTGPFYICVFIQEFSPGKPQPVGNTLSFRQADIDLVLGATRAAAQTLHWRLYPPFHTGKAGASHAKCLSNWRRGRVYFLAGAGLV